MKQALVITEWKRPKYLWLCLHAMQKVRGLSDYDVHIDIDGGGVPTGAFDWVIMDFPKYDWHLRPEWSGANASVNQWQRALRRVHGLGYEGFLQMEGDMLLRTDALEYLASMPKTECYTSLCAHYPLELVKPGYGLRAWDGYSSLGNWMHAEDVLALCDYLRDRRYYGKLLWGVIHGDANSGSDTAFCFYGAETGKKTTASDKAYLYHFGVNSGINAHRKDLEEKIFRGPKETWLDNLWHVKATEKDPILQPEHFIYE